MSVLSFDWTVIG